MIDDLLALQRIDTELDQLRVRLEQLPERGAATERARAVRDLERRRDELRRRSDELDERIESEERESAELLAHRQRLEGQLKTVIAPREAEALTHEIDGIDERRDALDDAELEALEQQSALDDELSALQRDEPALRSAAQDADDALAVAVAAGEADGERLATAREEHRSVLPAGLLAEYDRIRGQLGVAVARLEGRKCRGCHLDLSAAEVDDAKDEAAAGNGLASCPQCGRLLVV
jgi:predicted  nucleic acid-binding Zn-ribbon protein